MLAKLQVPYIENDLCPCPFGQDNANVLLELLDILQEEFQQRWEVTGTVSTNTLLL